VQDRARLEYVCGWGPKGAETSETCETGSFRPNKKLPKVEGRRNLVKRGAGIAEGRVRYNVSTSRPLRRQFTRPPGDLPAPASMTETERLSKLRHDLSNPLSALLAETQLLLLNESHIDPETLKGLREIEALAIRMRTMLREI
jgi:signal transduction histidine kinase